MGFYRRLIYDAFRRCNRKTSPVVESFSSRSDPTRSRISQPIFRNSILKNWLNSKQMKSPNFIAKRFYHADANKVHHFKPRRWYHNSRNLVRLGFVGCGVVIPVYYWNLETVPYTKRRHSVLVSPYLEKVLGDLGFKYCKSQKFKGKILDSDHPESIRVEKIGRDIIWGLRKGMSKLEDGEQTAHLEEFEWEFLVVDDPTTVDAMYFPGGKIVIFTGMLNYLQTDAEIATVIGHEVGHAVARHSVEIAEILRGIFWPLILSLSISELLGEMSDLFLWFPLSKRIEMEADYIGMLISASAGYDPRIAPEVYVKMEAHSPWVLDVYCSTQCTHPHGKKRAELLSQPKVMDEALSIYTEALEEKVKDKDKEGGRDPVGYLNFLNKLIGIF